MISTEGTIALTGIFTLIIAYSLFGNRNNKNKEKKILKVENKEKVSCTGNIERIIFACDAGMGSSAMAASMLKSKLKDAGINAEVLSTAVNEIPQEAKLVISHEGLTPMARKIAKDAEHISIRDYFDDPAIDKLINRLKEGKDTKEDHSNLNILKKENIKLNLDSVTKNQAIKMAGELLVKSGYVDTDYIDAMYERESQLSTYIGKGVAIPHGIGKSKENIKNSGIVFLQFPQGVMFGEDVAHILIGIAGAGNEHLSILSNLASALDEDKIVEILQSTKDVDEVYNILTTKEI